MYKRHGSILMGIMSSIESINYMKYAVYRRHILPKAWRIQLFVVPKSFLTSIFNEHRRCRDSRHAILAWARRVAVPPINKGTSNWTPYTFAQNKHFFTEFGAEPQRWCQYGNITFLVSPLLLRMLSPRRKVARREPSTP